MSFVYIIGGGPGAGKSSISEPLSKKYGFEYLRADDFVGEHQQEAAERKYPINNYLNSLKDHEQQLELIKLTSKQEIARQEELFFILLKELRARRIKEVILEGNCLLPRLVQERFEYPHKAVWLIPTLKFQKELYPKREWAEGLLNQSDDPVFTLRNWIKRDHEFNMVILEQAKKYKLPYRRVNGREPVKNTERWVEKHFDLK